MCTVSFVSRTEESFILTSNRDESKIRGLASSPRLLQRDGYAIACPVDPIANGSWIAASSYGDVICLLNGAFKKHKRQLPYRKSRGLVVLDYFETGNPEKFVRQYDLQNIEPFTLIMLHQGNVKELYELRWDGAEKFFRQLNENEFHLWSSATLYSEETTREKEGYFRGFLKNKNQLTANELIFIHQNFLYENWVKSPIQVDEVSTLSITSIESNGEFMQMRYRDLVQKELPIELVQMKIAPRFIMNK